MPEQPHDLQTLLIAAGESPPDVRGRWIEPLASHGARAIAAVADWVYDRDLAPFAFDVIVRAAELGAIAQTWSLLKEVERRQLDRDAFVGLIHATDRVDALPGSGPVEDPESGPLTRLIAGHIYRRRAVHAAGLGASLFHGISYPAKGGPVLLFSGGHGKFEGQFEYTGQRWEATEREGTIHQAIVFQLRRVADVVDVEANG